MKALIYKKLFVLSAVAFLGLVKKILRRVTKNNLLVLVKVTDHVHPNMSVKVMMTFMQEF